MWCGELIPSSVRLKDFIHTSSGVFESERHFFFKKNQGTYKSRLISSVAMGSWYHIDLPFFQEEIEIPEYQFEEMRKLVSMHVPEENDSPPTLMELCGRLLVANYKDQITSIYHHLPEEIQTYLNNCQIKMIAQEKTSHLSEEIHLEETLKIKTLQEIGVTEENVLKVLESLLESPISNYSTYSFERIATLIWKGNDKSRKNTFEVILPGQPEILIQSFSCTPYLLPWYITIRHPTKEIKLISFSKEISKGLSHLFPSILNPITKAKLEGQSWWKDPETISALKK